ncbi:MULTISPECIES: DUF1192 domain-containing protein [Thalassobaculum]|uniref:DUF1192 domain-containing protein n=1 Tax=Thalassobaculum litoreum DSM 18839 TaxID=1123362 RepID=A0A8G2BKQ4_9PROT|nr:MULTISPECIES: DUF1192 domain-containing protein [Thalassobaculum]SDF93747.1 Protein of unknown function [Thalassobaculum litoreum DSM 18839]
MVDLEELEPGKRPKKPRDLSTWNIEDLEDYIQAMQAEIIRAQETIDRKKGVADAANALFKS